MSDWIPIDCTRKDVEEGCISFTRSRGAIARCGSGMREALNNTYFVLDRIVAARGRQILRHCAGGFCFVQNAVEVAPRCSTKWVVPIGLRWKSALRSFGGIHQPARESDAEDYLD